MGKRPIAAMFTACLLGMLLSYAVKDRLLLLISFFLFFLFIIIIFLSFRQKILIFLPLFFLAGFFSMEKSMQPGILEGKLEDKNLKAVVRGYLKKIQPQGEGVSIFLSKAEVLEEMGEKGNGTDCEDIVVYVKDMEMCRELKLGNRIKVEGTLRLLEEPTNPGEFNQKLYYRSEKIYYRMTGDGVRIEDSSFDRLGQGLYELKERLGNVYDSFLDERDSGFIKAMILGDKSDMESERKTLFQKNGIAHILAISGMHLSILSAVLLWIFKRAGCYRQTGCVLSLIVILGYAVMSGEGISTMRTFLMMGMTVLSVLTGRSYDMTTSASLSAMILLFASPLRLTQPSFLLSYSAIFGIAVLYTEYTEQTGACKDSKKKIKRRGPEKKGWKIGRISSYDLKCFVSGIFLKAGNSLIFSFFVQIAILPVMLCFYYEIFPMTIILNFLVIPLLPFLFVCGFLGGFLGFFCPFAAKAVLYPVHIIFSIYEGGCRLFMDAPWLYLITGKPGILQILFYLLVISLFLFLSHLIKKKITAVFLVFILVLFIPFSGDNPWITFLDVGQGDGIVMGCGRREICVVDGGSSSVKGVGQYKILPFLKYKGIKQVDYWFVSHGDEDHYSGLMELINKQGLEHIRIKTLVLPELSFEDEAIKELCRTAILNGTDVFYIRPGQSIRGKYELRCIHPDSGYSTGDRNSSSMVLYWKYGKVSGILTGDLDMEGEEYLLKKGDIIDVDFLKAGHHGSKGSTGKEFLDMAAPELTVISCGKKNRYGHPHKELIERLRESGSMIFMTWEGAVTIESNGRYMRVERFGER